MRISRRKTQFIDFQSGQDNGQVREPVKILEEEYLAYNAVGEASTHACGSPHPDTYSARACSAGVSGRRERFTILISLARHGASCGKNAQIISRQFVSIKVALNCKCSD